MSEKMTTPLPCPFCGNGAHKISKPLDERFGYALEVSYGCPVCGFKLVAVGDSSKGGYADNRGVEEAALRKWNTRTGDASREAAIQAAVEAERSETAQLLRVDAGYVFEDECSGARGAVNYCVSLVEERRGKK